MRLGGVGNPWQQHGTNHQNQIQGITPKEEHKKGAWCVDLLYPLTTLRSLLRFRVTHWQANTMTL